MRDASGIDNGSRSKLVDLEHRFWQSMIDGDTDTALGLLHEPSMMVSSHGAMQFDHAQYRQMAEQGRLVLRAYQLSDMNVMFPSEDMAVLSYKVRQALSERDKPMERTEEEMADSSVWLRESDGQWRCVMHTETALDAAH